MKKNILFLFIVFTLIGSLTSFGQNIVINEFQSSNSVTIADEDGDYSDWIELYNTGTISVNLSGYGLSDNPTAPLKWVFPNISLLPNQYLLVWASGKNRNISGKPLHTNFKISSTGNSISLSNPSGTIINNVSPAALAPDISYGRSPNGTGNFVYFSKCTPGAVNSIVGYSTFMNPPKFSADGGFYSQGFSLNLSSSEAGSTILYTLDGSDPDPNNLNGTTYSYKNQYPGNPGEASGPLLQQSFRTLQY